MIVIDEELKRVFDKKYGYHPNITWDKLTFMEYAEWLQNKIENIKQILSTTTDNHSEALNEIKAVIWGNDETTN